MAPRILRREKMLEKIFKLKENNTTVKTEIIAGLTTFMTMAYIIALNPNLLTGFGKDTMPELWNGVFLATCIASAIGTIVMVYRWLRRYCCGLCGRRGIGTVKSGPVGLVKK